MSLLQSVLTFRSDLQSQNFLFLAMTMVCIPSILGPILSRAAFSASLMACCVVQLHILSWLYCVLPVCPLCLPSTLWGIWDRPHCFPKHPHTWFVTCSCLSFGEVRRSCTMLVCVRDGLLLLSQRSLLALIVVSAHFCLNHFFLYFLYTECGGPFGASERGLELASSLSVTPKQ